MRRLFSSMGPAVSAKMHTIVLLFSIISCALYLTPVLHAGSIENSPVPEKARTIPKLTEDRARQLNTGIVKLRDSLPADFPLREMVKAYAALDPQHDFSRYRLGQLVEATPDSENGNLIMAFSTLYVRDQAKVIDKAINVGEIMAAVTKIHQLMGSVATIEGAKVILPDVPSILEQAGSKVTALEAAKIRQITQGVMTEFQKTKAAPLLTLEPAPQPRFLAAEWHSKGLFLEEDPTQQAAAMEAYKKVIEIDPEHQYAWLNLGTLYYRARKYEDAEKCYRRTLEIDPNYALAYFDLANTLDKLRRFPEAVATHKKAIAIDPNLADAYYNLALLLEERGYPGKAFRYWRRYAQLDRSGKWHDHALDKMREIKKAWGVVDPTQE